MPTWTGFGYLATVLDVVSRRIVGWSYATHMRTELIVAAIDMAIETRRPPRGLMGGLHILRRPRPAFVEVRALSWLVR